MVVMFVDCCVGVYSTFRTIPTVESYGAGVFFPARTLIAVKLLNQAYAPSNIPFGRGYPRQIGRIQRYHTVGGANGTTMVVMFVG
jgi:hypothetical protein